MRVRILRILKDLAITLAILIWSQNLWAGNVVVLLYHKFGDPRTPSTNVPLKNFYQQMEYLKAHDYRVIPLKKLVSLLKEKRPLPDKTVVITVDDGYKTVWTHAFPILKQFGYPFTVFLPTEAIEKRYPDYLNWEEVRQMMAAGVCFEDHSYAHHKLGIKPHNMNKRDYINWIRQDLQKSRAIFKKRLGYEPTMLAFPYGYYNQVLIDEAFKLGYQVLLSQDAGVVSEDTPLWHIPREPILGKNWSTMQHFKEVLGREDLPLKQRIPPIGFLNQNPPTLIGAVLKYPGRYQSSTFMIYVSELGWRKAVFDRKHSEVFIENIPRLHRQINRIAIKAVDAKTGHPAISFWMVVLP